MKIGRIHTKSGILKVLLGLAAAGVLLFASCQNIFDLPEQKKPQDETPGFGTVIVDLGDVARTVRPDPNDIGSTLTFQYFTYKFTGYNDAGDVLEIEETWDTSSSPGIAITQSFLLPLGKYKIKVEGWAQSAAGGGYAKAVEGEYSENGGFFTISGGGPITVKVPLKPVEDATKLGSLTISVVVPTGSDYVFKLQQYVGGELKDVSGAIVYTPLPNATGISNHSLVAGTNGGNAAIPVVKITINSYTPSGGSLVANYIPLAPGSYLFSGKINLTGSNKIESGGFAEAVHIVSNTDTKFEKDFVDTSKDGPLAAVTDAAGAMRLLKEQFAFWIGADVLASENAIVITDGNPGTIQVNYIGDKMKLLGTPNQFPLALLAGWYQGGDNFENVGSNNNTWNVPNYNGSTNFKLINKVAGVSGTTYNARFNLELRSVIEFQVTYGKIGSDVVDSSNRDITIAGVELKGNKTETRKGLAPANGTPTVISITLDNAALMFGKVGAPKASATPVSAANVYTLDADTAIYSLEIWEKAEDQVTKAFERLRNEIAGRDTTKTPWIQNADTVLVKADVKQTDGNLALPGNPTPPANGEVSTYIYYVAERLTKGTKDAFNNVISAGDYAITIQTPQADPRWKPLGDCVVGVDGNPGNHATLPDPTKVTNSVGKAFPVGFVPFGGEEKTYNIVLKPVAEFEVDFYPDRSGSGTVNMTTHPKDPDIDEGGLIKIKDNDTSSSGITKQVSYTTSDVKKADFFLLGNSTTASVNIDINVDKVAIMIQEDPANPTVYVNAYKTTPPALNVDNKGIVQLTTETYNLKNAVSRVYKIRVYPSLEKQQKLAIASINALTDSKPWIDTTGIVVNRIEPFSNKTEGVGQYPGVLTTLPSSTIVFVGQTTQAPTITWATGGNYKFGDATKWPAITTGSDTGIVQSVSGTPVLVGQNGTKSVTLKFQPRGGLPANIYEFKLVRAVEYQITYANKPTGTSKATGTVRVGAPLPGSGTPQNVDYPNGTSGTLPLAGISSGGLQFTTTETTNLNVLYIPQFSTTTASNYVTSVTVPGGDLDNNNHILYTVKVYPSAKDQAEHMMNALKALSTLDNWGGAGTKEGFRNNSASTAAPWNGKSTFQIVGALPSGTVTPPASFEYHADYTAAVSKMPNDSLIYTPNSVPTGVTDPASDPAKGIRRDKIVFTPLAPNADATSNTVNYVIELQSVAKYNVVFMEGPNKSKDFQGSLQFATYEPGTGDYPKATNSLTNANKDGYFEVTQVGNRSFLGGIGTGNTLEIKAPTQNIFSTNITTTGAGAAALLNNTIGAFAKITTVTSDNYTINIYPSVAQQIDQVKTMMRAGPLAPQDTFNANGTVNTVVGWLDKYATDSNNKVLTNAITGFVTGAALSDGTPVSEIQYWGDEPVVKAPRPFIQNFTAGPNYNLNVISSLSTPNDTSANKDISWKVATIGFTPIASGSSSAVQVYGLRIIPVAKFNVEFTKGLNGAIGAQGQITITPYGANSKPVKEFKVTNDSTVITGYVGVGNTKIRIEAESKNFTDVFFMDPAGQPFTGGATSLKPQAGTATDTYGDLVTISREYTIRVSKQ